MKRLFTILSISVFVFFILTSAFLQPVEAAESDVYNGKKSLAFQAGAVALTYHTVTLEAGKTYSFSAWVKHPTIGAEVSINTLQWIGRWNKELQNQEALYVYGNKENESGHLYYLSPLITDGTWQKAKATFTIPQASGDTSVGDNVSPGTSPYYAVAIDVREGAGEVFIDDVWLYDVDNPYVNLIEDGGFENAFVAPNPDYFNGEGWRGAYWVSNRWFPQHGYNVAGSPFRVVSRDTEVVAPPDLEHVHPDLLVYNGNKSLAFQAPATALTYHTVTLEAGKTYSFSAWVKHPNTGAKVSMNVLRWMGQWDGNSEAGLEVYANTENPSGHLYGEQSLTTDGTWQKVKATYTIPQASGDPMEGSNVSPGTSPYYAACMDIRYGTGEIFIDNVWLYDVTNPYVNLIEDGGFENSVVGPNYASFGGAGWPGAYWVSNRWFPQYGWQVTGSPFRIVSTDTGVVAPPDPEHVSEVTLTKSGDDFTVGIRGWNGTHKYQIWTYQEKGSEIFGGEGLTNQWVLSHPYTLGSDRTDNGFTEVGDSITRNIGPFNSVDSNYTVAVKVIDGAGNFVGQYKDTFTQAEAGEVVINKVTVDGVFADDKAFVKDIANDSPVAFVVTGNGVAGTEYTAKIDQTGDQLVASGAGLNEFSWNISGMQPGNYSVTLTASTADSSDSRTVNIKLYKNDPAVVYGELTELVVIGAAENDNFKIDINPTVTGGKFRYRISEPWRGTIPGGDSELVEIPAAPLSNTAIPKTAYGVYEVQTFTYRDGVSSADDGAVRTVTNVRPGEPVTLNVTVDGNPAGAEMITKAKGTAIAFTPAATGLPLPQYSFWRRDANGWVLIRDYSGEGLTWTPNRVGLYTIQVRAKATGGLTYEVLKNIEFDITDATDKKAVVTGIAINQVKLDAEATARTPILITANAESTSNDLLYKFIISNGYIHYVETAYSADPTYMWVPGKAGDYTISVLVKNQASFGKYDAAETFMVTVQ